jgi:uncharacterized protein (TIGR02328 family)
MRLWSKYLIEYLPDKQLLSQWREIIAIIGNIKKKGFPNHILVNKIMDYPFNHFSSYAKIVIQEMYKRNFKLNKNKIDYVYEFCGNPEIPFYDIFKDWHNDNYTKICMYNLYEKYICGGITEKEWNILISKFEYLIN